MMFDKLRIAHINRETADSVAITLAVPTDLQPTYTFTQGQYITIRALIDDQDVRRSYSICSAPYENKLTVGIKKVPGGLFSTYANDVLKVGDVLETMPPNGNFYKPNTLKTHVGLACGSGITPILSIAKQLLQSDEASTFTLVYSNKNRASIMFFEAIEALKNKYLNRFNVIHILSRERTEAALNHGRINEAKLSELEKLIDYNTLTNYYLCGPEEMILSSKKYLEEKGVSTDNIRFELFGTARKKTATAVAEDDTNKSNITVKLDGRSFDFKLSNQGTNILDAALAEGADLPYACKGGVCCTCRAKLIQGTVSMDVNYALEPEEIADGYILTCQAHPTSSNVVVDFDVK
jgi:ring-1,2-phenylacetyl-CoA epoxidase subunit PaaE